MFAVELELESPIPIPIPRHKPPKPIKKSRAQNYVFSQHTSPLIRQIIAAIQEEGLTVKAVCDRSGIASRTVSMWICHGLPPLLPNLAAFAEAAGFDLTLTPRAPSPLQGIPLREGSVVEKLQGIFLDTPKALWPVRRLQAVLRKNAGIVMTTSKISQILFKRQYRWGIEYHRNKGWILCDV